MMEERNGGNIRVLHLDDDEGVTELTSEFLSEESDSFEIINVNNPSAALNHLNSEPFDCIVSDFDMPEMDGLEFLEVAQEVSPQVPFILFTGKGSEEIASEAISKGVFDYLQKERGSDQYTVLANRIQNAVAQTRAEQEIQRRSQWYRQILSHSSDYVLIVDGMGKVSYVSPAIERVMGYEPDEIIGLDSFETVHPDDIESAAEALAATIDNPSEEVTVEFRAIDADGENRWVEARGGNFLNDQLINGIMVNVRDISERKDRERELQQYRTIVEASGDPMYVLDREGRISFVNDALAELTGYAPETFQGEFGTIVMDEADFERGTERIRSLLSESEVRGTFEIDLQTADGDVIPCENHVALLFEEEEFIGTAGVIRNIRDRKARERELQRHVNRLDEFASVVSHDLRNPLNVAIGRSQLAEEECDSEHLEHVGEALDRMSSLIDDLLSLARQGESVGEKETIELGLIAERCWRNIQMADATLVTDLEGVIEADRSRVQQLLENLMRNAIDHAGADVTVTIGDLEDGFYVEDDGEGIPPEDRDSVFDAGYSTSGEGTGFGLSIVDQIVEAHGWSIEVTEGSSGGARFEITGIDSATA